MANVASIASARYQGGQLEAGQRSTIAEQGLEIVTPKNASRVRTAQDMKQIMGESRSNVNVTMIDQSTGDKEYTTEQTRDGDLILMIRDVVAGDIFDANSDISKSLDGSLNAGRLV